MANIVNSGGAAIDALVVWIDFATLRLKKQTSAASMGRAQFHRRGNRTKDPWKPMQPQPFVRHTCFASTLSFFHAASGTVEDH